MGIIKRMKCECGCEDFDVKYPTLTLMWSEHTIVCRKCKKEYILPVLYVNDKKFNGYKG